MDEFLGRDQEDDSSEEFILPQAQGAVYRSARLTEPELGLTQSEVAEGLKHQGDSMTAVFQPINPHQWNKPKLTALRHQYPLGQCKTRLNKSDLKLTLQTLESIFRTQSLHTNYNDSPISATCKSLDQVEFGIILFQAPDDPEQMIFEISRRDGDPFSFHSYAQQILNQVIHMSQEITRPIVSPSWDIDALTQTDSGVSPSSNEDVREFILIVGNLVSSKRYDSCKVGLQSLMHMTDPEKSGWSTAIAVTNCLIHPTTLLEKTLSNRITRWSCQKDQLEDDQESRQEPTFSGLSETDFAHLSLIILSQMLRMAAAASKPMDFETLVTDDKDADFVGGMLGKLKNVKTYPHAAYFAVHCLLALCKSVPSTKSRIDQSNVKLALQVGDFCHTALATVSQNLLVSLESA